MTPAAYFRRGILPILFAAFCWALSYFIRKYIVQDIGVFTITFVYSVAAAAFLSAIAPSNYHGFYTRIKERWKVLALMSFLSLTIGTSLMNLGLKFSDLGIATILEKSQTIFTVVIASVCLREKLSRESLVLVGMGLVATIGLFLKPSTASDFIWSWQKLEGFVAVTGAALVWSIGGILGRKLSAGGARSLDMALMRAFVGIISTLPLMIFFDVWREPMVTVSKPLLLAAVGGVLGGGVGYTFYYHGLRIVPAGIASMLELLVPVMGTVLGLIFLNEKMSLMQWTSSAVLLASVSALIYVESKKHKEIASTDAETNLEQI